jgi:multiple sugar transport system permease protein
MATNTMTTQQTQPPTTDKEAVQRRHRILAFQRGTEQVVVRIFLIAMCLLFLAPLYWMFITALKNNARTLGLPADILAHQRPMDQFRDGGQLYPLWHLLLELADHFSG